MNIQIIARTGLEQAQKALLAKNEAGRRGSDEQREFIRGSVARSGGVLPADTILGGHGRRRPSCYGADHLGVGLSRVSLGESSVRLRPLGGSCR